MDISIRDLSLGVILGTNDLDLSEIYKSYNDRVEVLKYVNKISSYKLIKENFDKFDPISLDKVIAKYWGKTINGIKCQKYINSDQDTIFIFGILEKVLDVNEEINDLFIVYSQKGHRGHFNSNLAFLKEYEVEQLINW